MDCFLQLVKLCITLNVMILHTVYFSSRSSNIPNSHIHHVKEKYFPRVMNVFWQINDHHVDMF